MRIKKQKNEFKYLQVAGALEKLIQADVLAVGDKLPSIRVVSEEYGISFSTALQSFYHLESKGLVEARPKSGYYVRYNNKRVPASQGQVKPVLTAGSVSTDEIIATSFKNYNKKGFIDISRTTPDNSVLPLNKLNKSVQWVLHNNCEQALSYEDVQGNLELRNQVCKLCFNWAGNCDPAEILVTAGCIEAIVLSLKVTTRPGDTVAVESPTYFGLFQILESLGLRSIEIKTDPVSGVDLDDLEGKLKTTAIRACVFVTNFNNPLGSCMPDEKKKELVSLISRFEIPLIEDDVYGELYFGKKRPKTCKTFDTEGWVLYCSSVSKTLAPGYRVGWCLPGRYMKKMRALKTAMTLSTTGLTQRAVAHFLSIGRYEYHLKKLRKHLFEQYPLYHQSILHSFPGGIRITQPQGGFAFWVELPKSIDANQLYCEAMQYAISLAPGSFFSPSRKFSNCIRLSYGKAFDRPVEEGLKLVGLLAKKQVH